MASSKKWSVASSAVWLPTTRKSPYSATDRTPPGKVLRLDSYMLEERLMSMLRSAVPPSTKAWLPIAVMPSPPALWIWRNWSVVPTRPGPAAVLFHRLANR